MASMNVALSGIARFYLALAAAAAVPVVAAAQAPQAPANADRPPLGSTLTVDPLGALPASATIFALLDTAVPDVIADRIDTGGLSAGEAARVGAHGSTWTQTLYRLGDADITDPGGSGAPLLIPGVAEWERVEVATGIMPRDVNAPGMAVSLVPRRATGDWTRWLDLYGSPGFLNSGSSSDTPPPIARLNSWIHGNLVAGGPVSGDQLSAFVSASWTRSSHFERNSLQTLDANLGSGFLTLTAKPAPPDQLRVIGWLQRSRDPIEHHEAFGQPTAAERDTAFHFQAAWDRMLSDGVTSVSAFGSVTGRVRETELQPAPFIIIERLTDGPVPALLDPGNGTDRVLEVGGRLSRVSGRHSLSGSLEWTRSSTTLQSAFTGRVGELVNGIPARAWDWTDPAAESAWHQTKLAAYASDSIALSRRLTINAGLRFESTRGFSTAATDPSISWNNLFPRAGLHVALTDFWHISAFAQYGRYGYRLSLRDLAYGDPTAPTGLVYRWNGGDLTRASSIGPLVERIGPGSGGNPNFSAIDPQLGQPAMNEMVFGFESRPTRVAFVRMAAIARYDTPQLGVVNIGVPLSDYTTIGVPDPGVNRLGPPDAQTLIFYNRSPSSFGADRYLLTNPADDVATFVGVDVVGEVHGERLFLLLGGTAGRSEALSANRGFGPLENDAGLLGELFIDPNARTNAQGRVFTERGYTIKTALSYRFEDDVTFGIVARYQDGEHFARMVVLDTLNQGAEAVRAFRNGRTRFTFSMTVDARLQKGFTVGSRRLAATIDAYNLFNQALSVEEAQVTGTGPRQITAVQPPRVIRIGLRIPL
jgi:hypothetical protein